MPGAIVRRGAYIAQGAVLMPSFVNIGARVGEGTMVDTWATVGSCAQIGANVHISGGAGIGGVLEPLQAGPVIIEDDCFIGARSEVAEGVVVERGAVLSMGVFLGASTKIVDRATGEVHLRPRAALIRWSSRARCRARTAARPRLRGDRQARRRAHALQDQHQRAAAGLDKLSLLPRVAHLLARASARILISAAMKPIDPHAFDRKLRGSGRRAATLRPAHDPHADEPQRLADPARAGGDLGRRLLLHRRRGPACPAADLCLAAADDRRRRDVAVPPLQGRAPRPAARASGARSSLLALLNNALPFTLFGWGQTHIASGLASILNATTPIWGVVVAHFLTRDERMSPRKIAGVLLGFGGVATMIGPSLLSNLGTSGLAQLACVAASLSYALAAGLGAPLPAAGHLAAQRDDRPADRRAVIMLPMSMIFDQPWTQPLPPLSAWAAITALALLCTAFGYVLYFRLIEPSGATNALLVTLLVPPVAILLGALFLGETLAPQDFLGLAPDRARPGGDRRAAGQPAGRRAGFRDKLSRLGARPVEVADVAPDFLAVGVDTGSRSAARRPDRARPTAPSSRPDRASSVAILCS